MSNSTVTDDEKLAEMAAKRMCINDDDLEDLIWGNATPIQKEYYLTQARAAIAVVRPHIEAAEREKCALDVYVKMTDAGCDTLVTRKIAAEIRGSNAVY